MFNTETFPIKLFSKKTDSELTQILINHWSRHMQKILTCVKKILTTKTSRHVKNSHLRPYFSKNA